GGDVGVEVRHRFGGGGFGEQFVARVRIDASHQQGGGDAFAGDVPHRYRHASVGKQHGVEENTPHAVGGFVEIEEFVAFYAGPLVGKEPELHLRGEIEVSFQVALFEGGGMELRVFEGESGLCGDADQNFQIVFRKRQRIVERVNLDGPQRLACLH